MTDNPDHRNQGSGKEAGESVSFMYYVSGGWFGHQGKCPVVSTGNSMFPSPLEMSRHEVTASHLQNAAGCDCPGSEPQHPSGNCPHGGHLRRFQPSHSDAGFAQKRVQFPLLGSWLPPLVKEGVSLRTRPSLVKKARMVCLGNVIWAPNDA